MTYTLIPNIWYTITPETDCDIDTPNGISIHLPAGIQYFHFADCVSIDISGTATVTQNPPLFKPASASALGGGYIESDLNVGHGAADAVAAQCTLTPGPDLDIGGTLEHDGSVVELEDQFAELDIAVSHPEYSGKLEVVDGGQTLYTFDTPAALGDFASIELTLAQEWELDGIEFALVKGDGDTLELAYSWEGDFVLSDFADFLNSGAEGSLGDFAEAQTWGPGIKITLKDPAFAGTAGNAVSYASRAMSPFTNENGETFSGGGENARDLAGLVEAMQYDDAPVEVEVNSGNDGVLLTSKLGGAAGLHNVVNAGGGDLWLGVDDTLAIANPRTPADLANVIEEDLPLMQLASASVSEGKIVLTAPTTPTAAQYNNLEYTATGCFGSGTVKQGSTTRGKNAVAQTDYEITLNGNQPRPLTPTTAMKHGGVYTVAADIDARLVTLTANATATIVVSAAGGPIPTVQLPAWKWCTDDGLQPKLDYFRVYRMEVVDDGFATSARLVSQYAAVMEWAYKAMTKDSATTGDITFVHGETSNMYAAGYNAFTRTEGGECRIYANTATDMNGDALEPVDINGEDFIYRITLQLATPHKFRAVSWMMYHQYLGNVKLVVQAYDGSDWVTVTDVFDHHNGGNSQIGAYLAYVASTAPMTDKWRFVIQPMEGGVVSNGHNVGFRYFRFYDA